MFGVEELITRINGTTEALVGALGKISSAIKEKSDIEEKKYEIFKNQIAEAQNLGSDYKIIITAIGERIEYNIKHKKTTVQVDSFGVCFYFPPEQYYLYYINVSFKFSFVDSIIISPVNE